MREKISTILVILSLVFMVYVVFLYADESIVTGDGCIFVTDNDTGITRTITVN